MGWAYGMDLRQRVVEAIEGGLSHRRATARFGKCDYCRFQLDVFGAGNVGLAYIGITD